MAAPIAHPCLLLLHSETHRHVQKSQRHRRRNLLRHRHRDSRISLSIPPFHDAGYRYYTAGRAGLPISWHFGASVSPTRRKLEIWQSLEDLKHDPEASSFWFAVIFYTYLLFFWWNTGGPCSSIKMFQFLSSRRDSVISDFSLLACFFFCFCPFLLSTLGFQVSFFAVVFFTMCWQATRGGVLTTARVERFIGNWK